MDGSMREEAEMIATRAGVLGLCELHEYAYQVSYDYDSAYRLGNKLFSSGRVMMFGTRRELTDAIKRVIDAAFPYCITCESNR